MLVLSGGPGLLWAVLAAPGPSRDPYEQWYWSWEQTHPQHQLETPSKTEESYKREIFSELTESEKEREWLETDMCIVNSVAQ